MTYHVRVCVVDNDQIIFFGFQSFDQAICDFHCTHFRFHVISLYFRGRHQPTIFVGIGFFHTAVKEKCYMSIFFCFSSTQLFQTQRGNIFTQSVIQTLRFECHFFIGDGRVIFCKANVFQILRHLFSGKTVKIRVAQASGDFSCTVRTEVIEDHCIMVADLTNCLSVFSYHDSRYDKFICFAVFIGFLDTAHSILCCFASAKYHGVISFLYPFPSFISVHDIETSHDCGNFTHTDFTDFFFQLCSIVCAGSRGCISAIQEYMDKYFFQTIPFCQLQQCIQVCVMAMNTTVRKQTIQMQCGIVLFAMFHSVHQSRIFKEIAIFNGFCDSGQFLIYDTASTDIQVTYFRVPHLSIRQTNGTTAGITLHTGIFFFQAIQNRCFCLSDGIAFCSFIDTEAIQDHQYRCFFIHSRLPPVS